MLIVLVLILSVLLARDISRPLNRLKKQADTFGAGDLSAKTSIRRSDELGELAATFNDMGGRIQAMVNREKEMLANISHEIRTPLSRVRVALELCAEEEGGIENFKRHLQGIEGDLGEVETMLNDALITFRLDMSQGTDRNPYAIKQELIDLKGFIDSITEKFQRMHGNFLLQVKLEKEIPPFTGDKLLLRRVVENLLDNAVKYSETKQTIDLLVKRQEDRVMFEIADNGRGVPPEDLNFLFEPFFRVEKEGQKKVMGLGLGLTLCKRIIEAHQGQIEAELRESGGLIVRFTLPLSKSN